MNTLFSRDESHESEATHVNPISYKSPHFGGGSFCGKMCSGI